MGRFYRCRSKINFLRRRLLALRNRGDRRPLTGIEFFENPGFYFFSSCLPPLSAHRIRPKAGWKSPSQSFKLNYHSPASNRPEVISASWTATPPASLAAIPVAPVTMAADPEHHSTAGPPANPLTQKLFAGPHPRPCGGTGQPRPVLAISIPSTDDAAPFFRAGAKTSRYRRSSKKTQPCSLLSLVPFFPLRALNAAPLLSEAHGRMKGHEAETRRVGSRCRSLGRSARPGEGDPRRLAPGAAPFHPGRPGEPACFGQRSRPRSGFHSAADGVVLPAPHQPRQPDTVCPAQRSGEALLHGSRRRWNLPFPKR